MDDPPRTKKKGGLGSWFINGVFICCCQGFLNPNGEGSKEYYELLGLQKNATLAEVRPFDLFM